MKQSRKEGIALLQRLTEYIIFGEKSLEVHGGQCSDVSINV